MAFVPSLLCLLVGEHSAQAQQLEVGTMRSAFVNERSYQYYSVRILPQASAIKVKLIPTYGDPDAYLSFVEIKPDSLATTWIMDAVGAEELVIRRDDAGFCKYEPCILHVSVYGYDESEYMIGVYDASSTSQTQSECAPGCQQGMVADGVCQQVRTQARTPRPAPLSQVHVFDPLSSPFL